MYPKTIQTVHGVVLPMAQFAYAVNYCRRLQENRKTVQRKQPHRQDTSSVKSDLCRKNDA